MCVDLPGGWQNPHSCQICGMVQCPLLCVCTVCRTSSRAVCDSHWAFLWGADGELIPDNIQELLEVGLPPLPCLLHSCFPICPTFGGMHVPWQCKHLSQQFYAFDGLFVHIFKGVTPSLCAQCRAGLVCTKEFLFLQWGTMLEIHPCWCHMHQAAPAPPLLYLLGHSVCYTQAKSLGPAFPNFRVDLGVATSQLII